MYEIAVNAPFLRTKKKILGTGGIAFVLSIDFEHRIPLVAQMVNIRPGNHRSRTLYGRTEPSQIALFATMHISPRELGRLS
jgi:hypothetical protein